MLSLHSILRRPEVPIGDDRPLAAEDRVVEIERLASLPAEVEMSGRLDGHGSLQCAGRVAEPCDWDVPTPT